jgi:hypothetical protein
MYHLLIVGCQGTLECYYFAVTLLPVTLVQVTKGTCSLDLNTQMIARRYKTYIRRFGEERTKSNL